MRTILISISWFIFVTGLGILANYLLGPKAAFVAVVISASALAVLYRGDISSWAATNRAWFILACVVVGSGLGGALGVLVYDSVIKSQSRGISPAGLVTFVGQVIDGWAPVVQENQTDTPIDDVHLSISGTIPTSKSPQTVLEWGSGQSFWNKEIEVGTVRALLTKSLDERFPIIPGHDHLFFYVFMQTRLRTFTERIYLTKKSEAEYEVKIEFGGADPEYTKTMTLRVAP